MSNPQYPYLGFFMHDTTGATAGSEIASRDDRDGFRVMPQADGSILYQADALAMQDVVTLTSLCNAAGSEPVVLDNDQVKERFPQVDLGEQIP